MAVRVVQFKQLFERTFNARALPVSSPAPAMPKGDHSLERAHWITKHLDQGHTVTKRAVDDACSCGATYSREETKPIEVAAPQTITTGTAQPVSLQADLRLPAVLGTLPRYRLFQFVTDCWECPDGEWVKFEDVAQIVSALQHEIAQLKAAE